jgi:uncharacterized membrane protein YgdD (TMEM256/DUF423 family)
MTVLGWRRLWQAAAGILGAAGVGLAAAAAHLSASPNLELAARFLLIDALALLGIAAATRGHEKWLRVSGVLFVVGSLCFSGGLCLIAVIGEHAGPLVPIGGTALILGWLALAVSAFADRAPPT